jgi:hypothetical protein
VKRTVFFHYATGIVSTLLVGLLAHTTSFAQRPASQPVDTKQQAPKTAKPADVKPADAKPGAKLPYELKVKTRPILNISLKADKAKMSEVAQDLSKRLKIPVFLGKERQNELLTIEFSELTLEPALQLLSPTVYVDYEIDTGGVIPPKPLGIFLYDTNQGEPPVAAVVTGTNQSMLIEGNTEDGVEPANEEERKRQEENPLRVALQNNLLSVKAKQQPLSIVLLKIGEELGIPVDIQDQGIAMVDAEISKLPVEDVVRQLSPYIRLYLRADLTRAEKRALRLVLVGPPKTVQQNP